MRGILNENKTAFLLGIFFCLFEKLKGYEMEGLESPDWKKLKMMEPYSSKYKKFL